jgi:uncharacterized RDD family membrane protein YckC
VTDGSTAASSAVDSARDAAAAHPEQVPPDAAVPVAYAGFVTRVIAFTADAAIINAVAVFVGVAVALLFSVVQSPASDLKTVLESIAAAAYVLWAAGYFVVFWSTTGQTPGDRLMRIRVTRGDGGRLHTRRAVVRYAGLWLAAIPLGAGFLPILVDDRRRGLQDWLARSVVIHTPAAESGADTVIDAQVAEAALAPSQAALDSRAADP